MSNHPSNPKVQGYALAAWERFKDEAKDGVWEGKTTDIILAVASLGYYSPIIRLLQDAGAIEQVRRGGGGIPSIWKVSSKKPNLEKASQKHKGKDGKPIETRVHPLEARLAAVEGYVGKISVPAAISSVNARLGELHGMIQNLQSQIDAMKKKGKGDG